MFLGRSKLTGACDRAEAGHAGVADGAEARRAVLQGAPPLPGRALCAARHQGDPPSRSAYQSDSCRENGLPSVVCRFVMAYQAILCERLCCQAATKASDRACQEMVAQTAHDVRDTASEGCNVCSSPNWGFASSQEVAHVNFDPVQDKYHLQLPAYPGTCQCVRLGGPAGGEKQQPRDAANTGNGAGANGADPASIRLNYSLAESSGGLVESDVDPDPFKQFDRWFKVGRRPRAGRAPKVAIVILRRVLRGLLVSSSASSGACSCGLLRNK